MEDCAIIILPAKINWQLLFYMWRWLPRTCMVSLWLLSAVCIYCALTIKVFIVFFLLPSLRHNPQVNMNTVMLQLFAIMWGLIKVLQYYIHCIMNNIVPFLLSLSLSLPLPLFYWSMSPHSIYNVLYMCPFVFLMMLTGGSLLRQGRQ